MVQLAREMPAEHFVFAGKWINDRPADLPSNVSFMRAQPTRTVRRPRKALRRDRGLNFLIGICHTHFRT